MKPTKEQQAIIDALPKREMMKINAVAGAGKTSTLKMLADSAKRTGLYLAFNKAMADEASAKFPGRIECRTTHALAYRAMEVFRLYPDKLNRPKGGYSVNRGQFIRELVMLLDLRDGESGPVRAEHLAGAVKRTLANFQQSADFKITLDHVVLPKSFSNMRSHLLETKPALAKLADDKREDKIKTLLMKIERDMRKFIVSRANDLWEMRIDPRSPIMMDHDTYLKMFQLRRPNLRRDMIFLDEAQDSNGCVLDLLLNQKNSQLVLVGDRRQQIYGWRGAQNAMQQVDCTEYPLSQSWRYGPAVASYAEAILCGDMAVHGNPALDTMIADIDDHEPHTCLYRTNAALLEGALPLLAAERNVLIEIDARPFAKRLDSALALWQGDIDAITDDEIREYGTWGSLLQEASFDPELNRIVQMIKDDHDQVPEMVYLLEHYQRPSRPDVIFSTAHKSKGREWANVRLADDFPSPYDKDGQWRGLSESEENLLYVAATRATRTLEPNEVARDCFGNYYTQGGAA